MNIIDSEEPYGVTAKTCGCKDRHRKVTYSFAESFHGLCKDKKDVILSEIDACERLRNYARDQLDAQTIEKEITELKMMLDLLP
jgi:hypothetical protein